MQCATRQGPNELMMINKNYLIQNAQVGLSSDVQMERQSEHRATLSNSPATFGAPMRSARPKAPASKKPTSDKLAEFFENDYILLTNLDRMVAERGRELMIAYGSLKPPDAVHLATAAISPGVEEMHTFDDRLLKLDGLIDKVDGTKLKICKPDAGALPAPLLEAMHGGKSEDKR
jgi:predicted nucleic acid-binding protein